MNDEMMRQLLDMPGFPLPAKGVWPYDGNHETPKELGKLLLWDYVLDAFIKEYGPLKYEPNEELSA